VKIVVTGPASLSKTPRPLGELAEAAIRGMWFLHYWPGTELATICGRSETKATNPVNVVTLGTCGRRCWWKTRRSPCSGTTSAIGASRR